MCHETDIADRKLIKMKNQDIVSKKRTLHKDPSAGEYGVRLKVKPVFYAAKTPDEHGRIRAGGIMEDGTFVDGYILKEPEKKAGETAGKTVAKDPVKPGSAGAAKNLGYGTQQGTGTKPGTSTKQGTGTKPGTSTQQGTGTKPGKSTNQGAGQKKKGSCLGSIFKFILFLVLMFLIYTAISYITYRFQTSSGKSLSGGSLFGGSSSKESDENPFNYYTTDRSSAAAQVFTDPSEIGAQTAAFGDDLYITNIDNSSGDMVGDSQELLIVKWNSAWEKSADWSIGSLEVQSGNLNKSYAYDDSYKIAEKYHDAKENYGSGKCTSLKKKKQDGEQFYVFQETKDDRVTVYALQERDGLGLLVCEIVDRLEEGETAPEETELFEKLVKGITIRKDDFENVTAASPFAARAIRNYDQDVRAIVSWDEGYEAELRDQYPKVLGKEGFLYWTEHQTLCNYTMYEYDLDRKYMHRSAQEHINYNLTVPSSNESFFANTANPWNGSESVSDLTVSDIEGININGYFVKYIHANYQYTYDDNVTPYDVISIGFVVNHNTYMEITDEMMDVEEPRENVEEIVRRLVGNVKIESV